MNEKKWLGKQEGGHEKRIGTTIREFLIEMEKILSDPKVVAGFQEEKEPFGDEQEGTSLLRDKNIPSTEKMTILEELRSELSAVFVLYDVIHRFSKSDSFEKDIEDNLPLLRFLVGVVMEHFDTATAINPSGKKLRNLKRSLLTLQEAIQEKKPQK